MESNNGKLSATDNQFAMKAAMGGQAEVQLGQLALQKTQNPQVKDFAQQMVDDHTKANQQLQSVAGQENMTLPTSLEPKDQQLMTKLQNESGAQFDRDYMKAMVKDHEEDVKEFKKEASENTQNPVKQFAANTLPILQQHLQHARQVESSLK